jgi:hypothetical protein
VWKKRIGRGRLTLLAWVREHKKSVKSPTCMGKCICAFLCLWNAAWLRAGSENNAECSFWSMSIILLRIAERVSDGRAAKLFRLA